MKLLELRKYNKKTQKEVANKLNIGATTLLNYEKGITEPDIETLIKLADYYKVSLDYLCERKSNYFLDLSEYSETQKQIIFNMKKLNIKNVDHLKSFCDGLIAAQ